MSAADSEPAPGAYLRFATEPYRPARYSNHIGLLTLLALAVTGGIGVGLLAGFLSQWVYVVVFFPLGIGLLVGVCGIAGVRASRTAEPLLAGSIGFLGSCLALFTMRYCEYHRFLDGLDNKPAEIRDDWHRNERGFLDYMERRARAGEKVPGRRGRGEINLGYNGTYIYWGAEVLLAGGLSFWLMWQAAAKPFCRQCRSWKETRSMGRTNAPALLLKNALTNGELTRLAALNLADPYGKLRIHVAVCARCGPEAPVDVQLQEMGRDKKGNDSYTQLAHVTYPGEALHVFEELARPPEVRPTLEEEQEAS